MPIRQFVRQGSFEPDDLDVMGTAFSAALNKLGLHDVKDPMVEMVARRIIRAVLNGERNVVTLTEIGAGGREPGPDHSSNNSPG